MDKTMNSLTMSYEEIANISNKMMMLADKIKQYEAEKEEKEYFEIVKVVENIKLFNNIQELLFATGEDMNNLQDSKHPLSILYVQAYETLCSIVFKPVEKYLCTPDGEGVTTVDKVKDCERACFVTVQEYYFSIVNKYTDEFYLLDVKDNIVKLTKVAYV